MLAKRYTNSIAKRFSTNKMESDTLHAPTNFDEEIEVKAWRPTLQI